MLLGEIFNVFILHCQPFFKIINVVKIENLKTMKPWHKWKRKKVFFTSMFHEVFHPLHIFVIGEHKIRFAFCMICICTALLLLIFFVKTLTLVWRFYFSAHVLCLGSKSPHVLRKKKTNNVVVYNGSRKFFDYHEFKDSGPEWLRQRPTIGQPEVAIWPQKNGSTYIYGTKIASKF